MNQTLALLITATVILLTAVITVTVFTGGISDFGESTENQKDAGCQFQAKQADSSNELSSKCRDSPQGQQYYLRNDEEVIDSVT